MNFVKLYGFILFTILQLSLLWCVSLHAQSSDFHFKNLSKEDGLSNNTVRAIVKDKLGFLWIGTNSGLCRYDAQGRMKVFRAATNDKLHTDQIEVLYTDSKGFLWVVTRAGLIKIDVQTNEWITYRHVPDDPNSLAHDQLLCITEDGEGRIWVGTEDGVSILYPEEERFVNFRVDMTDDTALQGKSVLSLLEDKNGLMWVGTWGGGLHLFLPNPDSIAESTFRNFMTEGAVKHNVIWEIHQDKEGRYWLGEEFGLVYMQVPEEVSDKVAAQNWELTFHDYNESYLKGRDVYSILSDSHANLWLSTLNGLRMIYRESLPDTSLFLRHTDDRPELELQYLDADGNNTFSIPDNFTTYLYEDDQQLIWICTQKGLGQFNWLNRQFEFIEPEGIEDMRNSVVVGEEIFFLIPENNKIIVRNIETNDIRNFRFPENLQLKDSPLKSISPNPDGTYSILSEDGIIVYDLKKNTCLYELVFKNYDKIPNKYESYFFYENKIWIGSEDGIYVFDIQLKQSKQYAHELDDKYSLVNNATSCLEVDIYGNLWIGTWNGISVLDKAQIMQPTLPDKFKFRNYEISVQYDDFISNKAFTLTNSPDRMYIGTIEGLMSFEYQSEQFRDRTNDKYRCFIHNINNLPNNEIWMSTEDGIANYNPEKQSYKVYSKEYGINNRVFLRIGKTYTDNIGGIYFTGKNRIVRIMPDKLISNDKPPKAYVTHARILNLKGERNIDLIGTDKLQLQYSDYYLALSFSILNYDASEKKHYMHYLDGFDKDWTHTQSAEPIVYTNLEAGEYTFKVKSANANHMQNDEGVSLKIIKKPALWETDIFIGTVIFCLILAMFWGVRAYNRRLVKSYNKIAAYNKKLNTEINERKKVEKNLQKKNDELISINYDLEQFAYICSHDLKEPIRGIYSFSNLIERKIEDKNIKKETSLYFKFVYNYLETLQNIISSLGTFTEVNKKQTFTPVPIKINSICKKIELNLTQFISSENAILNFNNSTENDTIYSSEYELILILQNLIHNGIKYNESEIPEVSIQLIEQEKEYLFTVTDNGLGIEKEYHEYIFKPFKTLQNKNKTNSSGLGLAISSKVINRLGGKIWVESELNKGSTFYVLLEKQTPTEENVEETPEPSKIEKYTKL